VVGSVAVGAVVVAVAVVIGPSGGSNSAAIFWWESGSVCLDWTVRRIRVWIGESGAFWSIVCFYSGPFDEGYGFRWLVE
jgi:hypothetical protein